jgi:PAS domain S-box-containing protein
MAKRMTLSLRTKISAVTTLTVIVVALMLGGLNTYNQLHHITKFEEKFLRDSIRSTAAISYTLTPLMVSDNFLAMNNLVSYYADRSDRLYLMVVDTKNRIVADSNEGRIGGIYEDTPAYSTDNVGGGHIRRFLQSGRKAIEVSYPVKAGDLVVGKVVMGLNMGWLDEETGIIERTMIFSTLIALVVMFLGALLASALARRVSQPIQLLTEAAEKVGRGDYTQTIHVESRDEVGILAKTFDTMVGELKSARAQLVEKNLLQARLRLAQFTLSHSMEKLLQATLDEIEALTGSTIGFYHFLEADQRTLSLQAWSTNTIRKMCTTEGRGRHYDIEEAGVWVDCVRERRPVMHNDYRALENRTGLPPGHADIVRELVVPILRGDRIVAIVGVGNKPDVYDDGDVDTVSYLADLAWDLVERKRAEEALLESEERYRSVIENVTIGISVISPNMEILSLNRTMKSWFPDIVVENKPLCYRSFYHPPKDGICADCPTFLTLKDGLVHEKTQRADDGRDVNYRVLSSPIRDQAGNVVAAIEMVEDITERKRAEEALRASETRLKDAQHIAHIGNWEWDIATSRLQWSEELYRIYGYEPHEIIPDYGFLLDSMHPRSREAYIGAVDAALRAGRPFEIDYSFFRKDGSEAVLHTIGQVHYDNGGVPVQMKGTVQDITERKNLQTRLEEKTAEQNIILENTLAGIVFLKGRRFVWFNSKTEQMFGYTKDEMGGLTTETFYPSRESYEQLGKEAYPLLFAGKSYTTERLMKRKDGSLFWCSLSGKVIDPADTGKGSIWMLQDITERKWAEEQIRAALLEKEILLKEVHHRVKNNLQVVASMLRLQARYLEDAKAKAMFEDSQRRVASMSLIHEKLYRSKDLARIDFREYITELVDNVTALNGGGSHRREVRLDVGEVRLDVNKGIPCGLIINELVSNALRHGFPEGRDGEVTVSMHRDESGGIALSVKDNGVGFPGHIDFRNTKSLGMQLVVSLVSQLDGTIELDRSEGTAFKIAFQT